MADLVTARDVAAQVELMAALRKSKAALDAFRALAESSGDTSLLSHFRCLEQDVMEAKRTAADTPGPGGMAALLLACLQGNAADVEFLLGFGADPTAEGCISKNRDKWKVFPLYIAARCGGGEKEEEEEEEEMEDAHAAAAAAA
eukprot:gene26974-12671_t